LTRTATTRPVIAARILPSLLLAAIGAGAESERLRTEVVMPWRKK
jgi:hypothetical protein